MRGLALFLSRCRPHPGSVGQRLLFCDNVGICISMKEVFPACCDAHEVSVFCRSRPATRRKLTSGFKYQRRFGKRSGATDAIANRADPWGPQRGQYQTQLNDFMKDPSSVLKDPAFLAAENLGAENISRQAGAAGMAGSGNRLADLFKYGQTQGLGFEQQKFNQLSQLAGVNAGSPVAAAGIQAGALQNKGTNLATGLAGILPMLAQLFGGAGGGAGGIADFIKNLVGGSGGQILPPNNLGGSGAGDGSFNYTPDTAGTGGPADPFGPGSGFTDPGFDNFNGFDWGSLGDSFSFGP
jgi:hypothetical protein